MSIIKKAALMSLITILLLMSVIWWRAPQIYGEWNKQTLFVWLTDIVHGQSVDDKAYAMWIDDDSSEGIFVVKDISDQIGIRPVYAVIADRMTSQVADSLVQWQRQGKAEIVLHGLRHERWKEWEEENIENDIRHSRQRLAEQGFDTSRLLKIIVPPHACNTRAIRKVIKEEDCQMITGASLVNPDRHVFQLGRISITPETDTTIIRQLLEKSYKQKAFVIFGTHSSAPDWFSEEKTRQVMQMAKEIGFCFDFFE
jgi:hypothetical protein